MSDYYIMLFIFRYCHFDFTIINAWVKSIRNFYCRTYRWLFAEIFVYIIYILLTFLKKYVTLIKGDINSVLNKL